ncbi:unnamed protein product [Cochlearia groenlandica]
MRSTIAHMYGLEVRVVSVEMTYWMEDALAELNGEGTQPLDISTNAEYRTFKTLHKTDKFVNILVTFKENRGGRLEILGPEEGEGNRVVEDDFDDCQLIECIEQIEEEEGSGGSNTSNECVSNSKDVENEEEDEDDEDYEDEREGDDEDSDDENDGCSGDGYTDEEDYDYEKWSEFVRTNTGGEDISTSKGVEGGVVKKIPKTMGVQLRLLVYSGSTW